MSAWDLLFYVGAVLLGLGALAAVVFVLLLIFRERVFGGISNERR